MRVLRLPTFLTNFLAEVRLDARPSLRPTIRTGDGPQRHHGIHVGAGPVHAAAFQSRLHHQLIGTLHTPAPDRQTLRLEACVLNLAQALGQIVERGFARLPTRNRVKGSLNRQVGQCDHHLGSALFVMFEAMRLLVDPAFGRGCTLAPGGLCGCNSTHASRVNVSASAKREK